MRFLGYTMIALGVVAAAIAAPISDAQGAPSTPPNPDDFRAAGAI